MGLTRHHVYPRRHFKRSRNIALQRTIFWLCRKCHDVLERVIRDWELTIEGLWKQLDFYAWVVMAFINAIDPERDLEPEQFAAFRLRDMPWRTTIGAAA